MLNLTMLLYVTRALPRSGHFVTEGEAIGSCQESCIRARAGITGRKVRKPVLRQ